MTDVFETFLGIFDAFRMNAGPAYFHIAGDLTYTTLHASALALSGVLVAHDHDGRRAPVLIYGHKDCRYPIAYWACLLAARPIVPIEPDFPVMRIEQIRDQVGASIMLDTTSHGSAPECTDLEIVRVPLSLTATRTAAYQAPRVAANDTMYIMFSSGTSGQPKGIRVTYGNVADFLAWLEVLLDEFGPIESITCNVRFCFDVSLFELWASWLLTKPLSALDHSEFFNSRKYIDRFRQHRVTTWVSTPTMIRRYLADPSFRGASLPQLNTFLFCGEVLPKDIVTDLWHRFDGCRVFNAYGPAECTVAVTAARILKSHVSSDAQLPIGYARPGTQLELDRRRDDDRRGEIIIRGRSVGLGYLNIPDLQAYKFPAPDTYRSGDWGHVASDGLWYFDGRMDREYKIQGVRIDLNDVEGHIRRLPGVIDVVADVYLLKGEFHALSAFVLGPIDARELRYLAEEMERELPPYLIPRFWYSVPEFRLNRHSKLDKASLVGEQEQLVRYIYRPTRASP